MAEHNPADVLKEFENKVEHEDIEIEKSYAGDVSPMVSDFNRNTHTTEEYESYVHGIDSVVERIDKDIYRKTCLKCKLQEAENKALKTMNANQCRGNTDSNVWLRPEPMRVATQGKDSGCYSATSADLRLYTENEQLVTTPSGEKYKTEEDQSNEII